MIRDDRQFLKTINDIARTQGFVVPALETGGSPSIDTIASWATFLQGCVRQGVELSDPRWERIVVKTSPGASVFSLSSDAPAEDSPEDGAEDFRIGLQLLMGMLSSEEDES